MKFSNETLGILKNFASINQGMLFRKGKTLKTVSAHKNILSEATISEDIPNEFGIHDVNNFLSVISLHGDDSSFEFDDKHVMIVGNKGRSKLKYRFADVKTITVPPENSIKLTTVDVKFTLTETDFTLLLKAANVLSSTHIAIESDGEKIKLVTFDASNDSASTEALEIGEGNGDKYRVMFKTETLQKVLVGDYDVEYSTNNGVPVAHFKNKKQPLQYWIAVEVGSKFEKAK
jgi:hypothetical protein